MRLIYAVFLQIGCVWCSELCIGIENHKNASIEGIFDAFGYSPECVASALHSCQTSSRTNTNRPVNIVNLFQAMKSLVQLLRAERENEDFENVLHKVNEELDNVTGSLPMGFCGLTVDAGSAKNISDTLTSIKATLEDLKPKENCAVFKSLGDNHSGVRTVHTHVHFSPKPVVVYCDQETDGGGWTVIQNRAPLPVRERFERGWTEYVRGFGDLNGEFWLGLENIHALTSSAHQELRIDLEDWDGEKRWAKYGIFHVGDAASKYVLRIGNYSGDAGDALTLPATKWHLNGMQFSTQDQDNDRSWRRNCAAKYRGGWWFNRCHMGHLNGYQYQGKHDSHADGIYWDHIGGPTYSLKKASMKIRPVLSASTLPL